MVAAKVCREVGLDPGEIILGSEIEDLSDDELGLFAEDTKVLAKMNPLQKARVVRALRARGHTVGYLGDGINDAVAMRDADVAFRGAGQMLLGIGLVFLAMGIIGSAGTAAATNGDLKLLFSVVDRYCSRLHP